ncbi:MAG: hypothetical protein V7607_5251 [Solirubrobacteraceae bacterium]
MGSRARLYLPALAIASLLALAGIASSHHGAGAATGPQPISAQARRAGLTFDRTVAQGDRQVVLDAIASAQPPARALIGLVDGLVDVHVGPTGDHSVGLTQSGGSRYVVTFDLGTVAARYGQRGIERLVLHELGHVVDFALVPEWLDRELDAGIPPGLGCDEGVLGGCADRRERFAETFAKWALGDIGVNLNIGYKVPPPRLPLEAWGAPLARLATQAPAG